MEYTLLRYADTPTNLTDVVATADPGLAVELTRRWCRAHPDEGVIVAIGSAAVVHCPPRRPMTAMSSSATAVGVTTHP
jgi:hypothetical protein